MPQTANHAKEITVDPDKIKSDGDLVNNESRSRLSLEMLNPSTKTDGGLSGTVRATSVLAGGLLDGMSNGITHSAENKLQTATTVAESFAVGYGLSAVSKMGKYGKAGAITAGLGMGAAWVYSEFNAGRPQATFNAVSDAYHSGSNLEANRKAVANSGGAILFDVALAGTAGGLGMKAGMSTIKSNWHVDAISAGKTHIGKVTEFLGTENVSGLSSRSFAGKEKGGATGVFEQVKELVNTKPKAAASFTDLQVQLKKAALSEDGVIVDLKGKLTDAHHQNLTLATRETQLTSKIAKQLQEKDALTGAPAEKGQLSRAQENLRATEEVARTIEPKRREHDRLFREREELRGKITEATTPDGKPTAEKQAFDSKNQDFRNAKTAFEEAKAMGGPEAMTRAKQRVSEAELALTAAEQAKPGKIALLDEQIKATEAELGTVRTQRETLNASAQELVTSHQKRMSELEADPTKLVKVEKAQPAKQAEQVQPVEKVVATKPAAEVAPEVVVKDSGRTAIAEALAEVKAKTEPVVVKEQPVVAKEQPVVAKEQPVVVKEPVARETTSKPAEVVSEKAPDAIKPVETVKVSPALETARSNAHAIVEANKLVREIEVNRKTILEIDSNVYKARPGESLAETRLKAEKNIQNAQTELGGDRGPSYTRALKVVSQYAKAVSKELAQTADSGKRGQIATQSVAELEGMMNGLPNSYKGFREKLADLREPGRGVSNGSPEKRLAEIQQHLESKTRLLDETRNRQLHDFAENQPVLKEILNRQNNGTLPEDGTIVLFGKNGRFINQPGTRSPHFIEVSRLAEHGVGADGAGFNRFTNNVDDIAGMVVLKPIYENGVKVQLNKGNNAGGRPVYKKMVADTYGAVPDEIAVNDNFVKILDKFGPERNTQR